MDDPVAEVLSQRAAMDRGAAAAIVLSLLAHGGLSALAIRAAWHHTVPRTPTMINIKFAKMPAAPVEESAPALTAAPPAPVPVAQPKTVVPPPKAAAKPVLPSPFGKSAKKITPPPAVTSTTTAAATATQPEIAVGGTGVTGLEGGDFPYTLYIDRMKTLVGSRWLRPQVTSGVTTTVYFVIERDGTLRDARIETPSGNGTFDRAALRAVLESSPLPPLPFGYSGTYLGVHLTFR